MMIALYYYVKTRFVDNVNVSGNLYFFTYCFCIGTVFQGPGFESRWRCMFFTLVVLLKQMYFSSYVRAIIVYYLLSKYIALGDNVIKRQKRSF